MKILNKQNCDYELGLMLIANNVECAELRAHELTRAPLYEYFTPCEELAHGNEWAVLSTDYDQYIEHVCVRVKDYNRSLDLYAGLLESDGEQ